MKIRIIYGITGGILGAVMGSIFGFFLSFFILGFFWLYVFGDAAWPDIFFFLPFIVGLIIAAVILILGIVLGYLYGKRIESRSDVDYLLEERKGYIFLAVSLMILFLEAGVWIYRQNQIKTSEQELSKKQEFFDQLVKDNQVLNSIKSSLRSDKSGFDIEIVTKGNREGEYTLKLEIVDDAYHKNIYSKSESFFLQREENKKMIFIDYKELIKTYHEKILSKRQIDASVQGNFILTATLEPILKDEELSNIDKSELQNLQLGFSDLISKKKQNIPFDFSIKGSNYEVS